MPDVGRTISHYRIVEKLGAGGMGVVYKALDPALGRPIALKLLGPSSAVQQERITRFFQEAKAASALNHPNIITIYEIGKSQDGRDFIAMEYIEGWTLRSLVSRPNPLQEVIRVGRQVAEALAVAHARSIIHRDVKPENIMMRPDGYVKVLDFGLARTVSSDASRAKTQDTPLTVPGTLVGTIAYMSPEQVRCANTTSATDVFSLGIILYELSTGRHPYVAKSQLMIVHSIVSEHPVPPSQLVPALPAQFDRLVLRMLEKDPGLRPTAAEVKAGLDAIEAGSASAKSMTMPGPARSRLTVGHEGERQRLRSAYQSALAGEGQVLCITGEPGIGKTTLVEDFLAEITHDNPAIGRGRCSERLAGAEAYLPLLEALECVLGSPSGGPWGRLLRTVAPTWYLQLAVPPGDLSEELKASVRGSSQERMKREITLFFQIMTRDCPGVLFLDDLHWADVSTIDILSYLGDRCREMRLLIVVAYRPTELQLTKHPFRAVKLELEARGACHEISVDFLSERDVRHYVDLQFSTHNLPYELTQVIHSRTEGNPLFVADLCRYLRDRGLIVSGEHAGSWELAVSVQEASKGLPESVRSMIRRKIERLSEADLRLLVGAAMQGHEFDSAILAGALCMDSAEVEDRLESLERVHAFVRRIGEETLPDNSVSVRYQFVHVLYQNALSETLQPTRRAATAAAVAGSLIRAYGERLDLVSTELAFLFETARDYQGAVDCCCRASLRAVQVCAHQEAVQLARRGLSLIVKLPDSPLRDQSELRLQLALSTALMSLRGYAHPEVEAAFTRALTLCRQSEDTMDVFQSLTGLGAFALFRPRMKTAIEILTRLQRMVEQAGLTAMRSWMDFAEASALSHVGRVREALDRINRSIALFNSANRLDCLLRFALDPGIVAQGQRARIAWLAGHPESALQYALEATEAVKQESHALTRAFTLVFVGITHYYLGNSDSCAQAVSEVERIASDHGFLMLTAWCRVLSGWAEAERGRPTEGITLIDDGLGRMRDLGTGIFGPEFSGLLAGIHARRGELDRARILLDQAITDAETSGEHYYDAELMRRKAELITVERGAGDGDAEALLNAAVALAADQGALSFQLRAATSLARLQVVQGRPDLAAGTLGPVYLLLEEGRDTHDLREAGNLLSRLMAERTR